MSAECLHPAGSTLQFVDVVRTPGQPEAAECICRLCGTPVRLERHGDVVGRYGGSLAEHGGPDSDGTVAPPHAGMML